MPVKEVLGKYTKEQIKKAANIKALFFDVDGVLTDGGIIYDDTGCETKKFNVKDGYIVSHLKKAGILVGIITGRESRVVSNRAAELKLDFCHQGIMDKQAVFEKLVEFHKLKRKQVAYIGDDINDLKTLQSCGLSACPADAPDYIKSKVDIITKAKGGEGVAREISDLILASKGLLDKILKT
ncbi:MAG: HAD-IIIA family hydrolase [Cyclobacteriaceae bacterium]|nr:HAD-IIIA family hydrolase [Cyclobacteriaceae bacterium]